MKATDPLYPTTEESSTAGVKYEYTTPGIDLLTHMSIEFTKALLSAVPHDRAIDAGLSETLAKEGIMQAKELIKQLNEEK